MRHIHTRAWLLALASGVLQVLIFPSPSLDFLSWIAIAPLIMAVLRARRPPNVRVLETDGAYLVPATAAQGFWLGYACGVVCYAGTCYWIYNVMHQYGRLSPLLSAVLLVLFSLYVGLAHGLFGGLLAALSRGQVQGSRRALLVAPFLWVAIELGRDAIVGFPWNLLGTAQVDNIPLAQIATVTGVYGVSWAIVLVNTAIAAAFLLPRVQRWRMLGVSVLAAIVLQAGVLVQPEPAPSPHTARLVQANIPILDSWSFEFYRDTVAELRDLSLRPPATASRPDLIVWPEAPAPFYLDDPAFRDGITAIARTAQAHVIAGATAARAPETGATGRGQVYNSAAVITPEGDYTRRYDKIHLVPFGEYVPFQSLLSFADKLTREIGDFVRGAERKAFSVGDYSVGVFICYESIFPNEVRQFARNGANVFVNISNDGWYGRSSAPGQHLNMARMRAVENRRWVLRGTNTGVTSAIDPYGRITAAAPVDQRIVLDAAYGVVRESTLYTQLGDWFAYLCAIIAIAALLWARFAPRRTLVAR